MCIRDSHIRWFDSEALGWRLGSARRGVSR